MKVLWVTRGYPPDPGGISNSGGLVVPALQQAGVEMHVVSHRDREEHEVLDGVPVHRLPTLAAMQSGDAGRAMEARIAFRRIVEQVQPDLVHLHVPDPAVLLSATDPAVRGLPQVVTARVELPVDAAGGGLLAEVLGRAQVITGVAGHLRDQLVEARPELAARTVALPNCVAIGSPPGPLPDRPVVVCAGRLEHQKGLDVLLHALPAVLDRMPDLRVVLVGDGAARGELEDLSRSLGVEQAVTFVGDETRAGVARWLAAATLVALPSRYEGMPNTALEAAAAGRAVVGSAVPGVDEVVVDGLTGVLVPPEDPSRLAGALAGLTATPDRCASMGVAARRHVERAHGIDDTARAYIAVYRRALRPPTTPGLASVIVPAGNAAAFVGEAVDSALAQVGPFEMEVVVVDDGSADDTATQAARDDPRLTVVRQCHGGPGAARNAGLALTTGEYVALLDADDRWPPGRLARLVGELVAEPALDAAFGATAEFGGTADTVARPEHAVVRLPTNGVVRRRAFERVGGFRIQPSGDAFDWIVRFLDGDPPVHLIDDVVVERRVHGQNTGRGPEAQRRRLAALKRGLDRQRF